MSSQKKDEAAGTKPTTVKRNDVGELEKPVRMPNGWLRVDARLTRTGIFPYANPDGSVRYELRLPDEVFNRDALESFAMAPVTDDHPPVFLTADNTKEYARGAVGENVRRDESFVRARLLIHDSELVKKLEASEAREVSCGYTCDLEFKQGEFEGQRFDAIQRNIRGNHVAIVPLGRAGREARVRMDAESSAMLSTSPGRGASPAGAPAAQPSEAHVPHFVRIDGIEFDVNSAQAQQAIEAMIKRHNDALKAKEAELAEGAKALAAMQAKADAAGEQVKKLDAELKAAPDKVRAELKARMDLELQARQVLGEKVKLDGLTDRQVKEKVLAKASPDLKLDGRADAYVDARFEIALEKHREDAEREDEETEDAASRVRRAVEEPEHEDSDDVTEEAPSSRKVDSDDSYAKMLEHNRNRWKGEAAAKK